VHIGYILGALVDTIPDTVVDCRTLQLLGFEITNMLIRRIVPFVYKYLALTAMLYSILSASESIPKRWPRPEPLAKFHNHMTM
jgi:hypothetical protein